MGGGSGKSKSSYKNPVEITVSVQGVFFGGVKGFAAVGDPEGGDLGVDEFMESVRIEPEKADLSNIGHPFYRPFTLRRFGHNVGLPERHRLAYDNLTGRYLAAAQLDEEMRVYVQASYQLIDDYDIQVGDTICIEDITMGVRRLFLVEGLNESESGIELTLLDVLGS
jgi:hypothetical protein